MDQADRSAELAGKGHGIFQGLERRFREINRHQNLLDLYAGGRWRHRTRSRTSLLRQRSNPRWIAFLVFFDCLHSFNPEDRLLFHRHNL
jgi:hypothetical protein